MRQTERIVMLQVIDNQWKDHLLSMDELKQGIGNRAYGQKDPLVEYKKESYELFTAMMDRIEDETVRYLYFLQVTTSSAPVLPFPTDEDDDATEEPPAGANGLPAGPAPQRSPMIRIARPPRAPWRTSRATSSARRTASWRPCSLSAVMARARPSRSPGVRKSAATTPAPAAAGRNTRSATAHSLGLAPGAGSV